MMLPLLSGVVYFSVHLYVIIFILCSVSSVESRVVITGSFGCVL